MTKRGSGLHLLSPAGPKVAVQAGPFPPLPFPPGGRGKKERKMHTRRLKVFRRVNIIGAGVGLPGRAHCPPRSRWQVLPF